MSLTLKNVEILKKSLKIYFYRLEPKLFHFSGVMLHSIYISYVFFNQKYHFCVFK